MEGQSKITKEKIITSKKNNKYIYKLTKFFPKFEGRLLGKKQKRAGQKSSLEELTYLFFRCMSGSDSEVVDIDTIVESLGVQRRRIYDITNVLEGKNFFISNKNDIIFLFYY